MSLSLPNFSKEKASGPQEALRHDLPASLVTFLVALPLSLGIALASGAPMMAGIIAAIIGGVVVGTIGGAPMQVSGPAAGLTVIVFGFVQQFGWGVTCMITVCAGLMQILLGLAGIAPLAMAISPAVIHGMMAAIGILIALSQIHVVLGGAAAGKGLANLVALPGSVMALDPAATALGLLTIAILIVWPRLKIRVPGSLMAVAIVTGISVALRLDVARVELSGSLWKAISLPHLPTGNYGAFFAGVLVLTMVASAESLLCAVATEKLHRGPRCCLHRELVAQGVGNAFSGLLGGLPVTGVVVRSKASLEAGAKSRLSSVLHGLWILVFVTLLPEVVNSIPLAVLAGLLVYTGIQLVNFHHLAELRKYREEITYAVTIVAIVGINLLAGLFIGYAVALLRLLWKLTHLDINIEERGDRWHITIAGTLTFAGVPKLNARLAAIPPGAEVDVHLALRYLDHAGCEALHTWQENHQAFGGMVYAAAMAESWEAHHPEGELLLVDCSVFEGVWAEKNHHGTSIFKPCPSPVSSKSEGS